MSYNIISTVTVIYCLACVTGCQKTLPEITILTGKVSIDGRPVTAGCVNILSDDQVTRTSGPIAADATYSIAGAPTGPVKMIVVTEPFKEMLSDPTDDGRPVTRSGNQLYVQTPKRYERFDTSGLAFDVPSGHAVIDLELTSK